MKAAFKKIGKSGEDGVETSQKNENIMVKFYIPDIDWHKNLLIKKVDTAGEVLVRVLNLIAEPLTEVDQYRIFKPNVDPVDGEEPPTHPNYHKDGKFIKNHRMMGDSHIKDNYTLYLLKNNKVGSLAVVDKKEKKVKSRKNSAISVDVSRLFGVNLEMGAKVNNPHAVVPYPIFIEKALVYLQAKGIIEGIFRLSGMSSEINAYKYKLDQGVNVDFDQEENPHNVAGLIKLYLRELPEPLMTWDMYDPFIMPQTEYDEYRRLDFYRALVSCLPAINRSLLFRLCEFFHMLTQHAEVTKMHFENLATVLGPNILKREGETMYDIVSGTGPVNAVTYQLLSSYNDIFAEPGSQNLCSCARALHDYSPSGENEGELELRANDVVYVTDDNMVSEGWWEGFAHGEFGFFPADYVKVICEVDAAAKPVTDRSHDDTFSIDNSNTSIAQSLNSASVDQQSLTSTRTPTNSHTEPANQGESIDRMRQEQASINNTGAVAEGTQNGKETHSSARPEETPTLSASTEPSRGLAHAHTPTQKADLAKTQENVQEKDAHSDSQQVASEEPVVIGLSEAPVEHHVDTKGPEAPIPGSLPVPDIQVDNHSTDESAHAELLMSASAVFGSISKSHSQQRSPKGGPSTGTVYHDAVTELTEADSSFDAEHVVVAGAFPVTDDPQVSPATAPTLSDGLDKVNDTDSQSTGQTTREADTPSKEPSEHKQIDDLTAYIASAKHNRKAAEGRIASMTDDIRSIELEIKGLEKENAGLKTTLACLTSST